MHPVWQPWTHPAVPIGPYHRHCESQVRAWSAGVSNSYGMEPANHMHMQNMLPAAETMQGQAASAAGFSYYTDCGSGANETPGLEDTREDLRCTHEAWERICSEFRGNEQAAADEQPSERVVGVQSEDGVFCPQIDSKDYEKVYYYCGVEEEYHDQIETKWVVNSSDWIDIECQLRKLLRCESPECYAFQSIGYIFFRSCAISHLENPGTHLRDGVKHVFSTTGVTVEIVRAHPEGVLEVACYVEYTP